MIENPASCPAIANVVPLRRLCDAPRGKRHDRNPYPLGGKFKKFTASEVMRPLPMQAKAVVKTAIDRFDDVTKTGQPAAPRARPRPLTVALRGTDHRGAITVPPLVAPGGTRKALIGYVRPLGWSADPGHAWVRPMPSGQTGLGQGVVFGPGGGIATAGDDPHGIDRPPPIHPLLPAQPGTPPEISYPGHPRPNPATWHRGSGPRWHPAPPTRTAVPAPAEPAAS